ncbi:MAG: hypothetical protein JXQ91_20345 [Vannielia sp.]|uniref:hypothetical protein n=1 Tax=Vannielia sp. TaxID=2813045 RepID=UPI003B8E21D8
MRDTILATAALLGLAACVPETGAEPAPGTIPASLQGQWGLTALDCEGGAAAKGLMTVGATTVSFYESRATLGEVHERDSSRIRATFSFSGEGQTWTSDMILDGQDGGETLIRRTYGNTDLPGPLKYTRCG